MGIVTSFPLNTALLEGEVRYDKAQTLTEEQQSQALANLSSGNITWSGQHQFTHQFTSFTCPFAGVEYGSVWDAGNPFLDFHSSGFANDYDVRLQVFDGVDGVDGGGRLKLSGTFEVTPAAGCLLKGLLVNASAGGAPARDAGLIEGWSFNRFVSQDLGVDASGFPAGSQTVNGVYIWHRSNGSKGINTGYLAVLSVEGSPGTANTHLNQFVAGQNIACSFVNMGGAGLANDNEAIGSLFGIGAGPVAYSGSTYLTNVSNELNAGIQVGASSRRFSVLSLAAHDEHGVAGSAYDAILSLSKISTAIGCDAGILFSDYNGGHGVATTGALFKTQGSATVADAINCLSYTFTGYLLRFQNFYVDANGDGLARNWSFNYIGVTAGINSVAITTPEHGATLSLADYSILATAGAYAATLTFTATTNVTFPASGTLATLAGVEELSNKTLNAPTIAGNVNVLTGEIQNGGTKVLGARGAAVADAAGGTTVDAEARAAINTWLSRARAHGLIAA